MFFRKAELSWSHVRIFLLAEPRWFEQLREKRRVAYNEARDAGTEKKRPDRHTMSPEEAWKDIVAMGNIRDDLIKAGWLPPRECDVAERRGTEGGTLFAGMPTKWKSKREYRRFELLSGNYVDCVDQADWAPPE